MGSVMAYEYRMNGTFNGNGRSARGSEAPSCRSHRRQAGRQAGWLAVEHVAK